MTSLPFQFLNSVLLWTSELAWACGHWHNNFNLSAFLGLSLPQSSLSRNIPGFCSCTKHDLTCHMAGNFGATTKLLYSICVYPILPLLGFFLTGSSFILSSFLALKAYLLKAKLQWCNLQPKHLGSGLREVFEPKRLGRSILRGLGHRRWWCRWGLTCSHRQLNGVVMVLSMSMFSLEKVIGDLSFSFDLSCYIENIPMNFMHVT